MAKPKVGCEFVDFVPYSSLTLSQLALNAPTTPKGGPGQRGGDAMLTLAVLLVIGVIALFVAFSIVGLITPKPDDQDSAASGVVQRQ